MMIISVIIWAGLAYFTARIAERTGRSFMLWLILGILFPIIAPICLLATIPSGQPLSEQSRIFRHIILAIAGVVGFYVSFF